MRSLLAALNDLARPRRGVARGAGRGVASATRAAEGLAPTSRSDAACAGQDARAWHRAVASARRFASADVAHAPHATGRIPATGSTLRGHQHPHGLAPGACAGGARRRGRRRLRDTALLWVRMGGGGRPAASPYTSASGRVAAEAGAAAASVPPPWTRSAAEDIWCGPPVVYMVSCSIQNGDTLWFMCRWRCRLL